MNSKPFFLSRLKRARDSGEYSAILNELNPFSDNLYERIIAIREQDINDLIRQINEPATMFLRPSEMSPSRQYSLFGITSSNLQALTFLGQTRNPSSEPHKYATEIARILSGFPTTLVFP